MSAQFPGTPSWVGTIGNVLEPWSAGETTVSSRPKKCELETAATVTASGAEPGDCTVPRPKSSRSFPAAITGTTPAAATFRIVSIIASLAGSVSGPPPEKLITSIPSATALSNAAAISGSRRNRRRRAARGR